MPLYPPFQAQESFHFISGDSGGYNPTDATAFYTGLVTGILQVDPITTAPSAGSGQYPTALVHATVREVYLSIVVLGTLGTTETGTGAIRVNNGTDNTVFNNTLQWNSASQIYSNTALAIPLSPGDFFSLKITPPTWATNPTTTHYIARVVVTYP